MKKVFSLILSFCLIFNLLGQTTSVLAVSKPTKPTAPTPPPNPLEVTESAPPVADDGPTPTPSNDDVNDTSIDETQQAADAQDKPTRPKKPQHPSSHLRPAANQPTPTSPQPIDGVEGDTLADVVVVENIGNGAYSDNTSISEQTTETIISQENDLDIENDFQVTVDTGDNFANYSVGDVEITTGDADVSLTLENSGNQNIVNLGSDNGGSCGSSVDCGNNSTNSSVGNIDNGAFSQNSVTSKNNESTTIESKNEVEVKNNFAVSTETGDNHANYTTTGDAIIATGDANTTINIINFANTNGVEIAVKEFNILDDQAGDVTLDFSGVKNIGNGAASANEAIIDDTGTIVIVNENEARIENEIVVASDTGGNSANFTTGGDAIIATGDANIIVNTINFLNNNLTAVGEIIVGVVNIFGDLVGNLVLPSNAINAGNGADSVNSAQIESESSETIIQSNAADIANKVEVTADTGGNRANYNTGGDVQVSTGETNLNVAVTTVANENVVSGDSEDTIFVVLVNEMGEWVGRILGATNENNGAGTKNSVETSSTTETTIVQENSAEIENNVLINANTGGNSTSYTTDGNTSIETGSVNVLTNVVNFINNNFVGKRIVLSIVNVFGSWLGDIGAIPKTATPTGQTEGAEESAESVEESVEEELVEETVGTPDEAVEASPPVSQTTESVPSTSGGSSEPTSEENTEDDSETNDMPDSDQTGETQVEEEEVSTETVLDIVADIGNGKVGLNQKLFSQSFRKKVIGRSSKKTLANRPRVPSPWANRRLAPTITDEIKIENNQPHLPWNFSSAILMVMGIVAGILRRFFN